MYDDDLIDPRHQRGHGGKGRLDGLADAPRSGAQATISEDTIRRVVDDTRFGEPPNGAPHWSSRDMAARAQISQAAVVRIRQSFNLQPHRQNAFKLSTGPLFIDKVIDVAGLYLKSARPRRRSVRGRETADPGPRTHRPGPAGLPQGHPAPFPGVSVNGGGKLALARRRHPREHLLLAAPQTVRESGGSLPERALLPPLLDQPAPTLLPAEGRSDLAAGRQGIVVTAML
ncbi:hypothetical protein [Streptomonospora alba]|uniref:hypothetical protein n=1 Tax=Streptomonospora alba TaxID=183763 RepID=UPI002378EB18|nr:hypothetical protein [Streptomonospora alba]